MRSDMTDKLGTWILMVAIGCSACRAPEKLARPAQQAAPSRVLFVGNSFTFYNNGLHNLYRAMVRERGGDTRGIRALTLSGGTLSEHRAGLGQRLAEQRWDAVVLQGHSRGPLVDLDAFLRAAAGCSEQVREQGARPWLMMTWAYEGAPGMTASLTPLPVFGVPVESKALSGQDSLLSIVQMPAGIPVGTLAIGRAGAVNAALLAAAVLALSDEALANRLDTYRARQSAVIAERPAKDEA